jgi:hypothetical protein
MLLIVDEAFAEMIADLKDPVLSSSRVFVTEYVVGATYSQLAVPLSGYTSKSPTSIAESTGVILRKYLSSV